MEKTAILPVIKRLPMDILREDDSVVNVNLKNIIFQLVILINLITELL